MPRGKKKSAKVVVEKAPTTQVQPASSVSDKKEEKKPMQPTLGNIDINDLKRIRVIVKQDNIYESPSSSILTLGEKVEEKKQGRKRKAEVADTSDHQDKKAKTQDVKSVATETKESPPVGTEAKKPRKKPVKIDREKFLEDLYASVGGPTHVTPRMLEVFNQWVPKKAERKKKERVAELPVKPRYHWKVYIKEKPDDKKYFTLGSQAAKWLGILPQQLYDGMRLKSDNSKKSMHYVAMKEIDPNQPQPQYVLDLLSSGALNITDITDRVMHAEGEKRKKKTSEKKVVQEHENPLPSTPLAHEEEAEEASTPDYDTLNLDLAGEGEDEEVVVGQVLS